LASNLNGILCDHLIAKDLWGSGMIGGKDQCLMAY
jgi:hypothetical protein